MKIRSKLLLIYGVLIALLLLAGFFSLGAIRRQSKAADELTAIYGQNIRAEKLRSNTNRQISSSLDFFTGELGADSEFASIQTETQVIIDELKNNSRATIESDLIEILEETQYELVWMMNRFFEKGQPDLKSLNLTEARDRLDEIGDEVSDDVASLNRYYNQQQSVKMKAAAKAGRIVVWVVGATTALALLQFIALVLLSQKWLVRPISDLNRAAAAISGGDLDIHIGFRERNEWRQLAESINKMTASLKETLQKLAVHERSAAMGELAAYAAHNIRNPLAGIRAAAQVMISDRKSVTDEIYESLTEIIETIDRLDLWLKRLLEFARPLEPKIETVDINRLVTESVSTAARTFKEKRPEIAWELSGDLPVVPADSILLEQALTAIAANAFEAIDSRGRLTVKTGVIKQDGNRELIEITLADNGRGVPREIQPKLFRAFMTSKDGGTGLGLAQAKKVVDIHGGQIALKSTQGKGTSVTIQLPLPNIADSN